MTDAVKKGTAASVRTTLARFYKRYGTLVFPENLREKSPMLSVSSRREG